MVKPCDLRRSLLFREIAILAVPRSPCLQNILLMTVQASSMPPRRPWPSRRRYCPGPRRAAIISGPTGGRRCPRYGALLKRGLGVRSSWPRSGSFNGLPRPDVARELPFKKPFQRRGRLAACCCLLLLAAAATAAAAHTSCCRCCRCRCNCCCLLLLAMKLPL